MNGPEAGRAGLRNVVVFTLAMIAFYALVGVYVSRVVGQGEGGGAAVAAGVNPEFGEEVFWGKGKCGTCHAMGERGSAVRCPNLGESDGLAAIGARAAERAAAAGLDDGTAYLVESLHDPAAYVVEGFSGDTMPKVFQPPIGLTGDEIRAVITYLQAQGGAPDPEAIVLPPDMEAGGAAGAAAPAAAWAPYLAGDPERGRDLFYDGVADKSFGEGAQACGVCHTVAGEGGKVGPELTDVALIRGPAYIIESILDPSAEVVANFAPVMPPNFAARLSVTDLHDILAFLVEAAGLPAGPAPEAGPTRIPATQEASP